MDGKDDPDLSRESTERRMLALFDRMDPDSRLVWTKVLRRLAERLESGERPSQEQLDQILEEARLENIRRRLGGKVGQVLAFPAPLSPTGKSLPTDKEDKDA